MKYITKTTACIMAAAMLTVSAPSAAGDDEIVVAAQPGMTTWVGKVSEDLSATFERTRIPSLNAIPSDYAQVQFTCDENGKPAQIALVRKSRSGWIDRAALRAVRRLKTMHPLPQNVREGQLYQADFIFAENERAYDRVADAVHESHARMLASEDRTVIALVIARSAG
ncbi:energy transducer TonB [Croceicoccus sediminis]|uniref:energy transducer TonB n=1 Tax=Croceicoccus sediminis TaxID=2571150 RepID=UPI00118307E5|nr:energy transducer TonB [Croceicoccus sediminis]